MANGAALSVHASCSRQGFDATQTERVDEIQRSSYSLPDDFDQHPFTSTTVELTVKELFPGTEVQLNVSYRDHCFATHHLPLQVRVTVIFAGAFVMIAIYRLVWSQLFRPLFVIVMQT